jgi:hypothetical protein
MTDRALRPSPGASGTPRTEVAEYIEQLAAKMPARSASGRGRLIFALDATASREPTWDRACHVQGEMFEATAGLGGLETQLVFYRGFNECKNSRWLYSAGELHRIMRSVRCDAGKTQIARVLEHAIRETRRAKVSALVFVGDAMEEELDRLAHLASELGTLSTPAFMLQEGEIPEATAAFEQIASLSRGAHLTFDLASIDRLKELLGAVAAYAAGGYAALQTYSAGKTGEVLQLTSRLRR